MGRSMSLTAGFVLMIPVLLGFSCLPPGPVDQDKLELPGLDQNGGTP